MDLKNDNVTSQEVNLSTLVDDLVQHNQMAIENLGVARNINSQLEEPKPEEALGSMKESEPQGLIGRLKKELNTYRSLNEEMSNQLLKIGRKIQ